MAFKVDFPVIQNFLEDGGNGYLIVPAPFTFQTNAVLYITSSTQPTIQVKVYKVTSYQVYCRVPITGAIADLSGYKVVDSAVATMGVQAVNDSYSHVSLDKQGTALEVTPAFSSDYNPAAYLPVRVTNGTSFTGDSGPLTPSIPSSVLIGPTSIEALPANPNRKGLILTNTSSNIISLSFGTNAVLNSGITLTPYGIYEMDDRSFQTNSVNAISSGVGSNLAMQEFT